MLRRRLADEERALEADVHRRVPGRFRQRLEFSRHDLHGVVDDDVDAPALLDDGLDEPGDVGGFGDVGDDREALAAECRGVLGGGRGGRGIDVIDDDMGALAGISQHDIAADTAAAAGDQRHLVLQSHGNSPISCHFSLENRLPHDPEKWEPVFGQDHAMAHDPERWKAVGRGRRGARPASKMAPANAIFAMEESSGGAQPPLPDNMAEPKRNDPRNDPAPLSPQPVAGGIAARALGARGAAYLADLNPEQREAVETLDGPVLVLAGAGTGKTRVLTTRIAHILNLGRARPAEILAVTFTNKAAREMKDRVGQMVGQIVEGMPWLGTFHSIGVKILRRHAELVGLKSNFTILDVDDQIRLHQEILEAEKLDEKRWPARVLAMLIDGWKNRGLTPEQVPSGEAASFANGKGKKLYIAYQERLKTLNAADFGDLLLENIRLFRQHADVLRNYQERFKFILVDEYQDTNVAQYLWLQLLAQTTSAVPGTALSPSSPGERRARSARVRGVQDDVGRTSHRRAPATPSFGTASRP